MLSHKTIRNQMFCVSYIFALIMGTIFFVRDLLLGESLINASYAASVPLIAIIIAVVGIYVIWRFAHGVRVPIFSYTKHSDVVKHIITSIRDEPDDWTLMSIYNFTCAKIRMLNEHLGIELIVYDPYRTSFNVQIEITTAENRIIIKPPFISTMRLRYEAYEWHEKKIHENN